MLRNKIENYDIITIKETNEIETEDHKSQNKEEDPMRLFILDKSRNLKYDPDVVRNNLITGNYNNIITRFKSR